MLKDSANRFLISSICPKRVSGRFPSSWKCAKVTYLFKQGDRIELIQINTV